ncbi:MAG TPA: aldo/keto reductase [Candidatus Methylacidiphilales bacterium]|jgi:aryl-alcohol dehydrogenase-like predicted oxidoreductase|nr:aldo/keto reductase [Candidatus Methylacidiphilales bacterium]
MPEPLDSLSPFTFGCMSLGRQPEDFERDMRVARAAMEAGCWFHASQEYGGGGTFMILRHAFDENRARVPKIILKIRCDHAAILKFDVEDALRRLKIDRIDLAQLCRAKHDRRPVVDDFFARGEMWEVCRKFQEEGKVGQFVLEIFASFSPDAIRAVQADLFPGYIFYFSPSERQVSNELFDLLQSRKEPLLSLRTMGGGWLDPARIEALRAKEPQHPLIGRFEELRVLYGKSGCASWPEFSFSFLKSIPHLRTSIAGTANLDHLRELLDADRNAKPMAEELSSEIQALHHRWFANIV